MKTTHDVSTKLTKDSNAQNTSLVIVWPDNQNADVVALATQALIVKLQGQWRRDEVIPAKLEVTAIDYAPGTRTAAKVSVDSLAAKAATLTADELKKLMAELEAKLQA